MKFEAQIKIEESSDYEGLWQVDVEERYANRFRWVGRILAEGVTAAVVALGEIRTARSNETTAKLNEEKS